MEEKAELAEVVTDQSYTLLVCSSGKRGVIDLQVKQHRGIGFLRVKLQHFSAYSTAFERL